MGHAGHVDVAGGVHRDGIALGTIVGDIGVLGLEGSQEDLFARRVVLGDKARLGAFGPACHIEVAGRVGGDTAAGVGVDRAAADVRRPIVYGEGTGPEVPSAVGGRLIG